MMKKKLTGRLPVSAVHAPVQVALLAALVVPAVAQAQSSNTIFPEGWDRSVRERMFMRLGYITANVKAQSSDATDMTGPVLTRADLELARTYAATLAPDDELHPSKFARPATTWNPIFNPLIGRPGRPEETFIPELMPGGPGLGTPAGIKAKVGEGRTVALSMGYWLTEDFKWALEAFLLAQPLDVKIYASGSTAQGVPLSIDGQHIISTKMLPPLAVLSRHFGQPGDRVRPFLGLGATYAVLYGERTTRLYDTYVGGKTSVTIDNAFGVGPFAGLAGKLSDNWHVNVQVGQIKLKTSAVLTSRNTFITSASSVTSDFPGGEEGFPGAVSAGQRYDPDIVTKMMKLVLRARNQANGTNHTDFGSYSRKQTQQLRSTIVNVSLGYSF